ncbi:hypothetical protein Fmac_014602 [Flemingia macrophylla]|uniref:Uncharacterized protein n=1 Tax=Flemingia macrophylla TaxID=520843 RepID=A0ABD1MC92_9FABA
MDDERRSIGTLCTSSQGFTFSLLEPRECSLNTSVYWNSRGSVWAWAIPQVASLYLILCRGSLSGTLTLRLLSICSRLVGHCRITGQGDVKLWCWVRAIPCGILLWSAELGVAFRVCSSDSEGVNEDDLISSQKSKMNGCENDNDDDSVGNGGRGPKMAKNDEKWVLGQYLVPQRQRKSSYAAVVASTSAPRQ